MIRRMQNKLLSLILTGLIAASSILTAVAETPEATVGIGLKKWDSEQKESLLLRFRWKKQSAKALWTW